jgi:arsenate reductase
MAQQRVLLLCTGNSARSQMGEAFLRYYAGDRVDVQSAGLDPEVPHLQPGESES